MDAPRGTFPRRVWNESTTCLLWRFVWYPISNGIMDIKEVAPFYICTWNLTLQRRYSGRTVESRYCTLSENYLVPQEQIYCFYFRMGWDTSRQPHTPAMKVQVMQSKPVLLVCFRSMSLANLSKFKLTLIPTNLTYINDMWLVQCLEEQRGVTLPPSMMNCFLHSSCWNLLSRNARAMLLGEQALTSGFLFGWLTVTRILWSPAST